MTCIVWAEIGAAALGILLLTSAIARLRGSTLVASLGWALFSLGGIGLVELATAITAASSDWRAVARYIAAVTTLAPFTALLGAKRPQNHVWQFVVVTLQAVLILPTLRAWLLGAGIEDLHPALLVLLVVILGMELLNYLPTAHWLTAILVAISQGILLAPYVANVGTWFTSDAARLLAVALVDLGILLAFVPPRPPRDRLNPLDALWLEFRNAYGAVWSLRVAARLNAAADVCRWPVRLEWSGLKLHDRTLDTEPLPSELQRAVWTNMRSILRRFVSSRWLDDQQRNKILPALGSSVATATDAAHNSRQ